MLRLILSLLFFMSAFSAHAQVVVSIKPLHSLVAAVMEGSSEAPPLLLVDGKASLHEFTLKPSQAQALRDAKLVFYIGDNFENFLTKILPQLPASTKQVAMENAWGITFYPVEDGNGTRDLHLWTSPANARVMVKVIAKALSDNDPAHEKLFAENAKKLDAKLAALDDNLRMRMAKLQDKPFIVFHDATQYFTRGYNLKNLGAITLHPEHGLSAKRVRDLREKIKDAGAVCAFREPEFEGRVMDSITQGTNARTAILDAEGALLKSGVDLYFQLMEGIAAQMETCLE